MTRQRNVSRRPKKRPYRAPVLKTHGDLKALTQVKGSNRSDGGSPKSRTTGGA